MSNWTGIVTRKYAERVMMSVSVAGGFVATDIPVNRNGHDLFDRFYACVPSALGVPENGIEMSAQELRDSMIRDNGCIYLGTDSDHVNSRGFATSDRIHNLLELI